jgi:hypothetical protein
MSMSVTFSPLSSTVIRFPQLGRFRVPGRPVLGRQVDRGGLVDPVLPELLQNEGRLEIAGLVFLGLAVPVDAGEMDLVLQRQLPGGLVDDGLEDGRRARRGPGRRVLSGDGAEQSEGDGGRGQGGGGGDALHGGPPRTG